MRKFRITLFLFLLTTGFAWSQNDLNLPQLNANLQKASTSSAKVDAYFKLAEYYFLNRPATSDSLAFLGISLAETSRDRKLMVTAYTKDGSRFLQNNMRTDNVAKALVRAEKALTISKQSKDAELTVTCYNLFARIHRSAGEVEKAIKVNNEAIALLPEISNDSLKIATYNSFGRSLRSKSDMLNAFKAHLSAFTIAEQNGKTSLINICNRELEQFYITIENYEKAKDYAFRTLNADEKAKDRESVMRDYSNVANIYGRSGDIEMAEFYFDRSEKLADSLKAQDFKINVKLGLINMYINHERFEQGLTLLKNSPLIFEYLRHNGMEYEIDRAKGYVQMMLKHYDSSFYYHKRAELFYETKATSYQAYQFYAQYSLLFKELKQWDKAIEQAQKARRLIESTGNLLELDETVETLDSLYFYNNNFKEAYNYRMLHQKYSDSLRKLSEQKDILSLEIDNENRRTERARVQEAEALVRRHNLQYMAITAAIASVFILLVVLGMFKVSASVVKALGFFAFIFLFEFIILILDNQIHHLTHGEPWKVIAIKIVLIAILLPFHHWLEEKVIHYLIENRLLLTKKFGLLKFRKATAIEE